METEDKKTVLLSCLNSSPSLFDLWNQNQLTDFKIFTENEVIVAHKNVLTSGSKYLADILLKHPEISCIDLHGTKYQDAFDIVRLLYVGQIEIENFRKDEFLAAAERLQVQIIHGHEGLESIEIPTIVHVKVTEDKSVQADIKVDESPIKAEDLGISKTDDGKFQCNQCGKIINDKSNANRHFKTQHIVERETFMTCPICPKVFNLKSKYDAHIQKNHQLTPKILKANVKPDLGPNQQIKTQDEPQKIENGGIKSKKIKTERMTDEETNKPKKIKTEH